MLPLFVFAGVFKNFANFPDWVGWIQYISPLKYCFISMLVNETNNKPSMIDQLNFDLEMWPSIFALIGLSIGLRLLALFFLWLLKTKIQ
jgi:ABC-type multidrug transport system permease subunit